MKRELKPIKINDSVYLSKIKFSPENAELVCKYAKYNIAINKIEIPDTEPTDKRLLTRILLENMISIFIETDTEFTQWLKENSKKLKSINLDNYFVAKTIKPPKK